MEEDGKGVDKRVMDLLETYWERAKNNYETAMKNGGNTPKAFITIVLLILRLSLSLSLGADPRVENWFLIDSPFPTFALCASYLAVCFVGPRVMATREPFQLKSIIIIYNLLMVALSAYMFYEVYNIYYI